MGESTFESRVQNRDEYQLIVHLHLKDVKCTNGAWNIGSYRLKQNSHQLGIFGEILVIEKRMCLKRLTEIKESKSESTRLMSWYVCLQVWIING